MNSRGVVLRSKLFLPRSLPKKDEPSTSELVSKSQRLLLYGGLVEHAGRGLVQLLPVAMRALEKLSRIVDEELQRVGCQKLHLPALQDAEIWRRSGRWEQMDETMLKLRDKHAREYCLAPTHEEAVTELVAKKQRQGEYPLMLYQTTMKFRDELFPRFGLLRAREFLMNDLYTFDVDVARAKRTYELIAGCYRRIFVERLRLDAMRVRATSGDMGGEQSHEFHLRCDAGQDQLRYCGVCASGVNEQLLAPEDREASSVSTFGSCRSIEVYGGCGASFST